MRTILLRAALAGVAIIALAACSMDQLMVRSVSDVLGGEDAQLLFAAEEDPELAEDALPMLIKLSETLVQTDPANAELRLNTGRLFITYANAFVQGPAELLPDADFERRTQELRRAKRLYLRGRDYVLSGLELRRPEAVAALVFAQPAAALAVLHASDIDFAFWAAAGWLGAFSADRFDLELLISVPVAGALLAKVLEWDDAYGDGIAHETMVAYLGGLPAALGGDPVRAREHFHRAQELAGGASATAYVTLATTVAVAEQDADLFRQLLTEALAIDVHAAPTRRLQNILAQRRARHFLAHIDDLFLLNSSV